MKWLVEVCKLSNANVVLFIIVSLITCQLVRASDSMGQRTMECIGRSEFTLPSDAEAGLYPFGDVSKLSKPPADLVQANFEDGQNAGYTQWEYRGSLYVTRPVAPIQAADILKKFDGLKQSSRAYARRKKMDKFGSPQQFEELSSNATSLAWRLGSSYRATWDISGVIMHWSSTYGPGTAVPNAQAYRWLQRSVPRAPFKIPTGPGVCLPSLFIPDDGKMGRFIASTYRLKPHPDVTVWIQDRDWDVPSSGGKLDHLKQAIDDNTFFWDQNYQDRASVHSLWTVQHPIMMRGVTGTASFVELTRKDGMTDYGYFASFWGSSDSVVGATQIKMFVIRDAKVAQSKSVAPVDRETLLEMAESVLHSIKARSQ